MYYKNENYLDDLQIAYDSVNEIEKLFCSSVFITGATGLIGSFLVDLLLFSNNKYSSNIEVYALGRDKEKLKRRFESNLDNIRLHLVIQDVVEPFEFEDKIDYIIHAAGDGYPAAFREHPVDTMTPAFIGSYLLLNYARQYGIKRLLYVSSGEIYGKHSDEIRPFKEDDICYSNNMNVRECYPEAKRAAEILCKSFEQQYGVDIVVARLSHTYGVGTSVNDNRATVQFLNNALISKSIELYSSGKQYRSYTYVADAVSGILKILICGKSGQAYNVANRNASTTIADFAKTLAGIAGINWICKQPNEIEIKEFSAIEYAVLDASKLEELGWRGKYSIFQGIKKMYEIAGGKQMDKRKEFVFFNENEFHKGFYNDCDYSLSLDCIEYEDFFGICESDDEDKDEIASYGEAGVFLKGACHRFAFMLNKIFGYPMYVIKGKDDRSSFHAFCIIDYKGKKCYVDARGITSSLDEFKNVIEKEFVLGEHEIEPIGRDFVEENDFEAKYITEIDSFAEIFINQYRVCYEITG